MSLRYLTPLKSAAHAFNPVTDVPGLNVLLDGSTASNFSLAGSAVLSWLNTAPSGVNYSLATASPTYTTNVQNGLSACVFDNTVTAQQLSQGAATALYNTAGGFYAEFVLKPTTNTSLPLFFAVNNEVGTEYTAFAVTSNASYNDILLSFDSGTNAGFRASTPNGFNTDILNQTNQFTFTYDGSGLSISNPGAFKIYFNGVSLTLSPSAAVGAQSGNNTVGGWGTNGNRINGPIMEAWFANQLPSSTLLSQARTYFVNKWAI